MQSAKFMQPMGECQVWGLWLLYQIGALTKGQSIMIRPIIAVSGLTEHCSIFHFPPCVRASVCHRRDISTFLDNLMIGLYISTLRLQSAKL